MIYLGVYVADLEMPWVRSFKEKRSLGAARDRKSSKRRFPVSVARLDGLNAHDWERIGAAALSSDPEWLEGMLNKVHDFVSSHGDFRVRFSDINLEVWDVPGDE